MKHSATINQIHNTPFKKIWKGGFSKRNRKLIKRALRNELVRLEPDTQKWRDVRTMLSMMGEEHHSHSEIKAEREETKHREESSQ